MRLTWPRNPLSVRGGASLDLSLLLENTGPERVEFVEALLVLYGRLLNEAGEEVVTAGFQTGRRLPRRHYVVEPGGAEIVDVYCYLSRDDQASLPVGRYTVVLPLGDARDGFMNSVLASAKVDPPDPLVVEVQTG
jgi:hypothetical protein